MKYTIGITGGSGFIGFALAKFFSKKIHIKILDIKKPPELLERMEYLQCDVSKYSNVKSALKNVDLVIHASIIQIPLINEQKRLGYEVNILGTQNVCKAVEENRQIKGMILAGSWHTFGEVKLNGVINEEFGYRPDKVEERARLYVLSKIAQETIVRFYDEMSNKIYGIIRMGTVLGEKMPEKTAARIFIERGLENKAITPFKHSMYRPMLYVDIKDVCMAYWRFAMKILNDELEESTNSIEHIINVCYPKPITILNLAEIVQKTIIKHSSGKICPEIKIIDTGQPPLFTEEDVKSIKVDISKAKKVLGIDKLKSPEQTIDRIIKTRILKR